MFVLICGWAVSGTAWAQEELEVTTVTTTESGGDDLLSGLWFMEDATPLERGKVDLRMTARWGTESFPANGGDSHDDVSITPEIYWGPCDNVEVSAAIPVWLGRGGDIPPDNDGNADITLGMLWRITEPEGHWPATALSTHIRTPSGRDSNGVDAELRLVLTNEYDSGIRSHLNGFVQSVNGNNDEDHRHFNWGVVLGLDGPLCGDGAVRWVADYMHRSSEHFGAANMNLLEFGWEWKIAEEPNLGVSMQVGLDDNGDTPNFGTGLTYAYSIMTGT